MVNLNDIENVINTVLKNNHSIRVKCGPTIAEMHSKLDSMDSLEKIEILVDAENNYENPMLNPLEVEDYGNLTSMLPNVLREYNISGDERYLEEYNRIYDEVFQYERRIIEGVKRNEVPVVDMDKFGFDELNDDDLWVKNGGMENQQINNQQSKLKYGEKIDEYTENLLGGDGISYDYEIYNDPRLRSMNNYFNGDCSGINYGISHEGYLNRLSGEQRKEIKNIDSLMEEGGGLVADTLLYRGGYWDIHLNPGDHSKGFKGYQSTTFLESVAKDYVERHEEQTNNKGMLIRILAPKGTKGIAGNDNRFMNGFVEHEYTLARNTGFTVLDVDYDNMVATVILDDP